MRAATRYLDQLQVESSTARIRRLRERAGLVAGDLLRQMDNGLRRVLALGRL